MQLFNESTPKYQYPFWVWMGGEKKNSSSPHPQFQDQFGVFFLKVGTSPKLMMIIQPFLSGSLYPFVLISLRIA
jgi:hypothetical protein